ncbi:MAG: glycosyltransferase family 4 protein [Candidatus Moranbacteria bacterium]|jgi:glycosyltransferase involved in cell wall biosynthesis|nr:glycosyltransferase family 4 protein [Candidatus Moranbacteria bacterium]MBP9801701.1 glycosyltransferase family 4 protein [Candidatus Moranbacteria bacterium]
MGNSLKKIVVFSPFYPPHTGGLESHSDEFNKHLSSRGVDIHVFAPRLPEDAPRQENRYQRVSITRFPAWEIIHNYPLPKYWPFWWNQEFFILFKKLFQEQPDIVISRTRFFSTSLLAIIYAKLKKVPLVHIEHGSGFAEFNGYFKTKLGQIYDLIFGQFVLRSAHRIVGNSHATKLFVKKLCGRSDCKVIYRGVEIKKILSAQIDTSLASTKEDQKDIYIGYIGRLIDGKGVTDLLLALAKLKSNHWRCLIVGDGPEKSKLEDISRELGIQHQVDFFGNQSFEKAMGILKACDIIVNPSYTEGIPTSIIEAALCRKAIIATDVGGTKEIITGKDDGFLIPPRHPEILLEKLEILMENEYLRNRFSEAAFFLVHEKFSWNRAIDEYLEIFSALLANKKN